MARARFFILYDYKLFINFAAVKKPLITELLNVFAFYLSEGMENAVRVFPKHRAWLTQHAGRSFREVENELLKASRKLIVVDKKQTKPKRILRRYVSPATTSAVKSN